MVFGRFKRGNTAALEALANAPVGAATMIEGERGLIIGTMILDEAGDRWIEHLIQDARGQRFWISIENYDETKATRWDDIDMWAIEGGPDDQRVVYNGVSFKKNESGTAGFQAKGDVGVNQEGSLDYVDFVHGDDKLSFERFGEAGAHRRSRALSGTCPNCGAPLHEVTDGICSSCGSRLTVDHGWFGSWEVAAGRDISGNARLQ